MDRWTALDIEGELLTRRRMIAYGRRFARAGRGAWYSFAIEVVWQFLVQATRFRVRGSHHIPKTGGVLVASNHLSFADPATLTAFCLAAGRVPRYLAKASLWKLPVLGAVMRSGRHIPVYRGAATAAEAYRDLVASVRAGDCVAIIPEGPFSNDPDGWQIDPDALERALAEHGDDVAAVLATHTFGTPIQVYPLYENALRAHTHQSPATNHAQSAKLYAEYAEIASSNEAAWSHGTPPADFSTISTVGGKNRMICHPCERSLPVRKR